MPLTDVTVDVGTVAVLALVMWLDGWRRLSADALLVGRVGFGSWNVSTPSMRIGAFALVAWWAPIVVPVILASDAEAARSSRARWTDDFGLTAARGRRRLARIRGKLVVIRVYGIMLLVWMIVGIPMATALLAGRGLIYGVLGAFGLAAGITLLTVLALHPLGFPFRRAMQMSAPLLSPFTAPRATEIVTAAAIGPLYSLAPVAALLGEDRFLAWLRPWAYDELAGRRADFDPGDGRIAALVGALPRPVLEQAVRPATRAADDDGARYCPRCTRTYRDVVDMCSNCEELALVALGTVS